VSAAPPSVALSEALVEVLRTQWEQESKAVIDRLRCAPLGGVPRLDGFDSELHIVAASDSGTQGQIDVSTLLALRLAGGAGEVRLECDTPTLAALFQTVQDVQAELDRLTA
jgi:hypothetical protein